MGNRPFVYALLSLSIVLTDTAFSATSVLLVLAPAQPLLCIWDYLHALRHDAGTTTIQERHRHSNSPQSCRVSNSASSRTGRATRNEQAPPHHRASAGICTLVRPSAKAYRTRPAILSMPNFFMIRLRCHSTVFALRHSILAIILVDLPSAIS
jgi:hypothetical protein